MTKQRCVVLYRTANDIYQFPSACEGPNAAITRVAFSLCAWAELELRNLSSLFACDLIQPGDYAQAWHDAEELARIWSTPLGADFDELFGGLSLADLFAPMVAYFAREAGSHVFRRSLYVVKNVKADETSTEENVRSIRPGYGLHTRHLEEVWERWAAWDIAWGTPLSWGLPR